MHDHAPLMKLVAEYASTRTILENKGKQRQVIQIRGSGTTRKKSNTVREARVVPNNTYSYQVYMPPGESSYRTLTDCLYNQANHSVQHSCIASFSQSLLFFTESQQQARTEMKMQGKAENVTQSSGRGNKHT
eukprot:scaffold225507_cov35-Prasinocladus_malaysianus.AAC.1